MTATAGRARPPSPRSAGDRRRKEDQRLITGRTRWTDNITLPGMLHLAMVRSPFAHAKITSIDTAAAKAAPERRRRAHRQGPRATSRACCINAWPITPDQKAPAPPADRRRPGRVRRRDRRRRRRPHAPPRRATPPSSSTSTTTSCRPRSTSRRRAEDEVLAHPDLGTNKSAFWVFDSAEAGTGGDVDEAIAKARADGIVIEREYRQQRLIPAFMEPRSVGGRPDRRADHHVVGDPDPAHPAVRARRDHRRPGVEDPGDRARRRRRFRRQAADHPRGVDRLVVGPRGSASRCKYTETRSESLMAAHHGRDQWQKLTLAADEGRHGHRPQGRPARRPRRLRRHRRRRRPGARRVHVQRDLQVPGLPVQLPDGAHQQDLDRRLPRRRPARGDVRHRADDGRARRRGRRRPARDPREELDQARGVPVHHGGRADVRLRQLRGRHRARPRRCSGTTSCAPSRSGAASAGDPVQLGIGVSTFTEMCGLAPSRVLGQPRLRRRRLGARERADARHRQGRGRHRRQRRTARATRRRSARSSPTGSACPSRTSRCCTATPRSRHKGLDTYGSRSLVVGGEALVQAADKVIEKAKPIAAHLLEAVRRRPRVRRRPVLASGAPTRAWRSARSRCAAFAAHNLPDGVEPSLDADATLRPGQLLLPARHAPVRDGGRHRDRRA